MNHDGSRPIPPSTSTPPVKDAHTAHLRGGVSARESDPVVPKAKTRRPGRPAKAFKPYAVAGGIVYDPNTGKILLIKRKDLGTLQIPKGHQEQGEKIPETAIREVQEETGYLHLRLVRKIDTTQFYWQDETTRYKATLHIYWMELVDHVMKRGVKRDVRGGEFTNIWVPLAEAIAHVSYKNLHHSIRVMQRYVLGKKRRPYGRPNGHSKPGTRRQPRSGITREEAPRRPADPTPEKPVPRPRFAH